MTFKHYTDGYILSSCSSQTYNILIERMKEEDKKAATTSVSVVKNK